MERALQHLVPVGPVTAGPNRALRRHPAVYTADQVAELWGVSTWLVYRSVKEGTCPVAPIAIGRRLVWPKVSVDRMLGLEPEAS